MVMATPIKFLNVKTYVGIRGAGKAWPWGLPGGIGGGAPPPGRFGIAGACLPAVGGGGGTLDTPEEPSDPVNKNTRNTFNKTRKFYHHSNCNKKEIGIDL